MFSKIISDDSSKKNNRGQDKEYVQKNVDKGKTYEKQFQQYMVMKYDIILEEHHDQFNSYDFWYLKDDVRTNILIEYKWIHIKCPRFNDNKLVLPYDNVIIPVGKIDAYLDIYEKNIKKNKLMKFFYMISFYYEIDSVGYKNYKYCYLDLYKIKHQCNVRDQFDNENDFKPHYLLPVKWFNNLSGFQELIANN